MSIVITIEVLINAPLEKVWNCWTAPEHITKWNFASIEWICPFATNDFRVEGQFSYRMESRDGDTGFDFRGTYTSIEEYTMIEFALEDDRKVCVEFRETPDGIEVSETFDAENENAAELQRSGWQAILNNFKNHVESLVQ